MGDVIFLRRREPEGTAREADASTARSMDELPPIAPWRRRQFDAELRAIIGVETTTQTVGVHSCAPKRCHGDVFARLEKVS
jgi:hypothetical protein